jgi:hypothetical protein
MDNINEKIALLEDQIENIERSGYFTEKEIDRASFSLRDELESLKKKINNTDSEYQKPKLVIIGRHFSDILDETMIKSLKFSWNKGGRDISINKG